MSTSGLAAWTALGLCVAMELTACQQTDTPVIGASDGGARADSGARDGEVNDGAGADAGPIVDASSVDKQKLGGECSATNHCPGADDQCVDFRLVANGDPELQVPRCVPAPVCSHVTCPTGKACVIAESYPLQISCE